MPASVTLRRSASPARPPSGEETFATRYITAMAAHITRPITLGHRANTGEDTAQVALAKGEEVTILAEWSEHYLIRNGAGQLFNAPKDAVSPDPHARSDS